MKILLKIENNEKGVIIEKEQKLKPSKFILTKKKKCCLKKR